MEAAPIEHANVQRQVNLNCSLRLVRPGNMANLNPDLLGNINNLEDELGESVANYITEILNAQDNPDVDVDERFIMRPHSNINIDVNRAQPDGNVFNVRATFTVKYNNVDFWDYDDRFMDSDVNILQNGLVDDYSSRVQNINNVAFYPQIEDLDIHMDAEQQFVPHPMGGGRRRSTRRRRITHRRKHRGTRRNRRRVSRRRSARKN